MDVGNIRDEVEDIITLRLWSYGKFDRNIHIKGISYFRKTIRYIQNGTLFEKL